MLEVITIIKRHNKQLQEGIRGAIFEYEVSEKKIRFEEMPTFSISQDIELGIGEKEYKI